MEIDDIHTHHLSPAAIFNESPLGFTPREGYYYSLGIHPWRADEDTTPEWKALQLSALHPQVLAIGETGLDKLHPADSGRQQQLFEQQVRLAEQVGKPLIIHCVKRANEVIAERRKRPATVPWIIHGFRGNRELAAQFLRHGFYLSFGEHYQEETLKSVPFDRLLIETDESTVSVSELYLRAARLLGIPVEELRRRIGQNVKTLFF